MKWLLLVAIIILIGGAGYFVFFSDSEDETTNTNETATEQTEQIPEETTELTSIQQLIAKGGTSKCTYDYTDESGVSSAGTAYFHDGKMFGDFTATQEDGTVYQSNVLNLGNTQYVWEKTKKEGYKLNLSAVTGSESGEEPDVPEQVQAYDQNQDYEFKCTSWSFDQAMFNVPEDVDFIDQTELINSFKEGLESLSDMIPE